MELDLRKLAEHLATLKVVNSKRCNLLLERQLDFFEHLVRRGCVVTIGTDLAEIDFFAKYLERAD